MSRGHNPLIWMMAVSLPTAGHALGLGEIHVNSALNEPLSAEIDIVGAAPEELTGLIATVANRDTFLHFGAERQNFLSSTTFKVTKDVHGRPVLAIRSSESFTEPLVDLVVDLRWRNGELIRQYTLLLDPAGFPSAARSAQPLPTPANQAAMPAPLVSVPATEPAAQNAPVIPSGSRMRRAAPLASAASQPTDAANPGERKSIKVGAKATLRGIAWRVGARSRPDINRLMYAIFRANPAAFDGNINKMHLGALLTIPSADEVAAIQQADANREIRSQMSSWLSTWKGSTLAANSHAATLPVLPAVPSATAESSHAAPAASTPTATARPATAPASQVSAPVAAASSPQANPAVPSAPVADGARSVDEMNDAELNTRIKMLETSLRDMQAQLESEHNKMLNIQAQVRFAEQHPSAVAQAPAASASRGYMGYLIGGIAVLLGALGALFLRSRRTPPSRPSIPLEPPLASPLAAQPMATPKPAYSPAYAAPARAAASKIEVVESSDAEADSLIELSRLEPSDNLSAQLGIDHPTLAKSAPSVDTNADTTGVDAARLRDEESATRMREELEAAWSIPAAEQYQRHDETETTLAEAIERSLVDTARLRATQLPPVDMVDASDTSENKALDFTATDVEPGETVVMEADTTKLPAATMAMHADEIARAFEEPTVQQPRPDPNHIDFDLLNLDSGNAPSSDLHGHVVAKGRSTALDGLKSALERAPVDRPDVRMVLIETYFEQSVLNRQTFQDALETLNREHGLLTEDEWEKVNQMAKQMAA